LDQIWWHGVRVKPKAKKIEERTNKKSNDGTGNPNNNSNKKEQQQQY